MICRICLDNGWNHDYPEFCVLKGHSRLKILDFKLLTEVVGGILEDKMMLQMMVDEQSRNARTVTEKVATDPSRTAKNTSQTRYSVWL